MTILDYILLKNPGKSLKNWIGKSYPTQLTHLTLHKQTITCSQNWPFNSKRKASTTSNIQNRQFRTSFYPWRQSSLLKGLMIYLQDGTLSWSVMAHILLIKTFSFFNNHLNKNNSQKRNYITINLILGRLSKKNNFRFFLYESH